MRAYFIIVTTFAATLAVPVACGDDDGGATCGDGRCASDESCSTCPVDCGVCCGDDHCAWDETCSTCPADCGECPCTAADCTAGSSRCCPGAEPGMWRAGACDCDACTTYTDCGTTEICAAGSCAPAWGRAYRVVAVNGVFSESGPDGSWDTWGGLPDPYITMCIDGRCGSSSYVADTLRPTWNFSMNATLYSTSTFTWTVYDDDYGTDDTMLYRTGSDISVQWLREGTATFSTSDGSSRVRFDFQPR
ncbi:MAG: hypothetical protein QME96_12225 [Myxococcota bacterium]|nr:hypothetical protein [Myxococcota bacterium]